MIGRSIHMRTEHHLTYHKGAKNMKLSTIAKTTLALGILTTGIMTTNVQYAQAEHHDDARPRIVNSENKFLHEYYSRPYYEYKKVSVFKKGNKAFLRSKGRLTNILLSGDEKNAYANGKVHNLDVFTVQEEGNQRVHYSVGGLSRTNFTNKTNWSTKIAVSLYKTTETAQLDYHYNISSNKQQLTLKELDFKLRQNLIKNAELYENGYKYGDITVKMKNGTRHVIDLTQSLQYKRMGVLISPEDIEHIDIHIKKIDIKL